ncbi:MAG TPA: T9SS type A sorting domain-containing protein [Bacteroidia bacterium]|nr:T9SS type A sorting domain-containing protein [Bacteroidia bacterium]
MTKHLLTLFALASFNAAMAQAIPNAGMETWAAATGEETQPQSWISYNVFTSPLVDPGNSNSASVTQATGVDAYQGTYSAKITTIDLVYNPDPTNIPNRAGVLLTGGILLVPPYLRPGYQSTDRPETMTYYAKYAPVGSDMARAFVALTKWNASLSVRDTVAYGSETFGGTSMAYALHTVTLTYLSTTLIPDTAVILFSASDTANPQLGSALWVDALGFNAVGVDEQLLQNNVVVYPNPSNTQTNFDVADASIKQLAVYDMTGREVCRAQFYNKKATIDSYNLTPGIYSYAIIGEDDHVATRGKFTVSQ